MTIKHNSLSVWLFLCILFLYGSYSRVTFCNMHTAGYVLPHMCLMLCFVKKDIVGLHNYTIMLKKNCLNHGKYYAY